MTEGDTNNIPALETVHQEESEKMAEEEEFCSCIGTKTKANIKKQEKHQIPLS